MSKLREVWESKVGGKTSLPVWDLAMDDAITEAEAEITRLRQLADYEREVAAAEIEGRKKAEAEVELLRKLDAGAANVESIIALRTDFTGEPPYVGWDGLALALTEKLDALTRERDEARSRALDEALDRQPDVTSASEETRTAIFDWWTAIRALKGDSPTSASGRPASATYDEDPWGDVMTVAEYLAGVADGSLMDDDGSGRPMKDGKSCEHITINPSDGDKNIPLDATHIEWFNR